MESDANGHGGQRGRRRRWWECCRQVRPAGAAMSCLGGRLKPAVVNNASCLNILPLFWLAPITTGKFAEICGGNSRWGHGCRPGGRRRAGVAATAAKRRIARQIQRFHGPNGTANPSIWLESSNCPETERPGKIAAFYAINSIAAASINWPALGLLAANWPGRQRKIAPTDGGERFARTTFGASERHWRHRGDVCWTAPLHWAMLTAGLVTRR